MHLEGGHIVKANNETALNYFTKSADKVASDHWLLIASHFLHCYVKSRPKNVDFFLDASFALVFYIEPELASCSFDLFFLSDLCIS